ncbi:MAG: hypothetical protein AAGJ83_07155 [Planctomycetota bacterium]
MSRISRRRWLHRFTATGMSAFAVPSCIAQEDVSLDTLYVRDRLDQACERAIEFLIRNQREKGSITDRGHELALTSLAVMALASVGVEPAERTAKGRAMKSALDFVLQEDNQTKAGYYGNRDGSRMYGHGIVTLMLTEMLGMGATEEQNKLIHERLTTAIQLILSSQAIRKSSQLQGGWRYTPGTDSSDLSVSIWQLMALRSAKNDGMDVPLSAIDSAVNYLRASFTGRKRRNGVTPGGFVYQPGQASPTFAMTAAGLLAMQVCGRYEADEVSAAADWLLAHPPRVNERYLFYGLYYYAQGMHQFGGKHAEESRRIVAATLLPNQRGDGSWMAPGGEERNVGLVYSTALAVLSLSVRFHYLPIYQR